MTREEIRSNIKLLREDIEKIAAACGRNADEITLIAATKTQSADTVNTAIEAGILHIGENRAQELCKKYPFLINRDKLTIHFIGHLQSNKVKLIIDKVDLIHSVDRLSLAKEIDRQSAAVGRVTDILVEVNIGREPTKSGVMPEQALEFVRELGTYKNIRVCGLMTIPPAGLPSEETRRCFSDIRKLFIDIRGKNIDNIHMKWLSMGMSGDYQIAIEEGTNFIRIGTALFGPRN